MLYKFSNIRFLLLSFCLFLIFFGCTKSNKYISNGNIEIIVQSAADGIYINIFNVPQEIDRIHIDIIDESSNINFELFVKTSFAETVILGNSLEQVKQSGQIFFPFIHSGHKYSIRTHLSYTIFNGNIAERGGSQWIHTEFIAKNGNFYDNYFELNINETFTSVTLSCEPVFPSEMKYKPYKYRYGVHILENETSSHFYSYTKTGAGIHWEFNPELSNILYENYSRLKYGDYLVYIQSYCNVTYNNITWEVKIANSPVFTYTYNMDS